MAATREPGPSPGTTPANVDRLLERVRRGLDRVEVDDLERRAAAGALVVDIRPSEQRQRHGLLPGAVVIDRNVLEWRLDPTSPDRLDEAGDPQRQIVLVCQQGYSSSLAAASLQQVGLPNATDLVGGFEEWARRVRDAAPRGSAPA
jgi:rhodanese-related sulfurtransferase